jgi:pyruvate/2-oxoglutarate dehydrogenase complex dihydrolipoamide dehydrogenase (E3) component
MAPVPLQAAVVGAGPAGMAAAAELARAGVAVHVYDENAAPGRPAEGVALHAGAVVWGIFEQRTLAVWAADHAALVRPEILVLATGAHDRPVPLPGWTLPGVFASAEDVPPGARVVVAGASPHLPDLAAARVVAVVDAAAASGARTVARVLGTRAVQGVVTVGLDADWRPVPGGEATVEADAVCLGFGRVPAIQLGVLAGCEHRHVPEAGGWVPVRSDTLETTVSGVFAAGDAAGIGGARLAETEGRIAGLAAATRLGALSPAEGATRLRPLQDSLAALRRDCLACRHVPRLAALITPDTVLCRCETVTAAEVDEVLEEGAPDLAYVKRMTRAGMGLCQGRLCEAGLAAFFTHRTGQHAGSLAPLSIRPPVRPVPLDVLAGLA